MTKYNPTNWVDSLFDEEGNRVQKGTPAKASLLNNIEQGIVGVEETISTLPKRSEVDSLTSQLADKAYYTDSILTMKNNNRLKAGNFISTLGYYTPNDGGGAKYQIIDDPALIDDGGSIHNLSSGLKAKLIIGNGVDCLLFGAGKSNALPKEQVMVIFKSWTNYVNNTPKKYFEPSESQTYFLYEPLYIQKSFIGVGMPSFMYLSSEVGKVVSATEKTPLNQYNFNVSAVIGVNPKSYTDTEDRLRIENFKVFCTNEDNDTSTAQDFGVYFPVGNSFNMRNILVVRPNVAGFVLKEVWMGEMSNLNTWHSRYDGFSMVGVFTSLTVKNCYAHGFKNRAWDINGAVYSTFMDLAADGGNDAFCSYSIASCWGTNFYNLGSEGSRLKSLFYIGDLQGNISGVFNLDNEFSESVFSFYKDSQGTIDGLRFNNCRHKTDTTPSSFKFQSATGGANYNVIINNPIDGIVLGEYTAKPSFNISSGKIKLNTIEDAYTILNNKKNLNVDIIDSGSSNGNTYKKYSDGKMECTYNITLSALNMSTTVGSSFVSNSLVWTLPTGFTSILDVNIMPISVARHLTASIQSISNASLTYSVVSPVTTTFDVTIKASVIGRWK